MKTILRSLCKLFLVVIFCLPASLHAQPLAGNYTINSAIATGGSNFQTFNDFASSLNANGISANVVASVTPGSGPYQESVIFHTVTGASSSARVTIAGNAEVITAVTTSADRHVIRLTDVSFFTIDNLHVIRDTASTGGFYGIHIFNTGSDITISSCDIDIGDEISTLYGAIVASGSETSILTTGDFHRLTLTANTTRGGGYGISVFGLVSNLASDILIEYNDIFDFHSNGVYLRETNGAIIRENRFDKTTAQVTSMNCIQIAQNANINANIYNNFIKISQTANGSLTMRGIYLFNGTGHKVYNNVIHDIKLVSGNFVGIEVRTAASAPKIYFNTITFDNPSTSSGELFGIQEESSNTNSEIRNNMINITQQSTGLRAGIVLGSNSTLSTAVFSDNNNVYVPGGNFAVKASSTPILYPSLSDWNLASTQDAHSYSLDPMFTTGIDPIPTNTALNSKGVAIAGYSVDVLGNLRDIYPDMGAYEFLGVGVKGIFSDKTLAVYPNPVKDHLTVKLPETLSSGMDVKLFSIDGKLIKEGSYTPDFGQNTYQMNTSELNPGLYILHFIADEKVYQGRFVKGN
jgi:hypothetical protein